MKKCPHCSITKELLDFIPRKDRGPGTFYAWCRKCMAESARKWADANKDIRRSHATKRRLKDPIRTILGNVRMRANILGVEFTLIPSDIKIPTICPVLGIPITLTDGRRRNGPTDNSPSIDRINPGAGYTKDNIIITSWRANRLKADSLAGERRAIANFYDRLT